MIDRFLRIRENSEQLCKPLYIEDYSLQASEFVSPPKWHLAHSTWFWEEFVLTKYDTNYILYNEDYHFLFNSYYNNVGKRVLRPLRGLMSWHTEFKEKYKIELESVINDELQPKKEGISMGETIEMINKHSKGDAIMVSDVGQHQMFACRYAKFNSTKSNVTSGGLGTMGFALPAAIGAKMGMPDREVVAIIGDGGFQMTIQELGTIFQTKVPVKIVVLNNEFLGMVRQWQQLFFDKRYASTEMTNPNFTAIAEGYYIKAKKVIKREDLDGAVAEMMASKESYFLEVMVEKEHNVFPMIPTGASVSDIRLS